MPATDGTPLNPDEQKALIPNLSTQEELNEWERKNIVSARVWALDQRRVKSDDPLRQSYVRELHRRMFDQTWKWAGTYRKSEKNIGVPFHEITERLENLLRDARYWIELKTYAPEEIAVRLHHGIAFVHPFPNGNGRHARLMADVVAVRLGQPVFSWGGASLTEAGELRRNYIQALQAADNGDFAALFQFCRS